MARPTYRSLAALFAIWFAVFTAEPARVHSCPEHDGAAAGVAEVPGHAGHHGMDMAGDHGSSGDAPSAPHRAHQCTCPSKGCCSTSVASLPPAAPIVGATAVVVAPAIPAPGAPVVDRSEHVLPFATAP